jgi:DHA1 family tetracycline resistance protein-like MFS transporter
MFVLYATYRYLWNERTVGLTLGAVGICFGVVQAGLVGPIVARLGERRTLWLGLLFGIIGFAAYGLAPTGKWFLAAVPIMALWGLSGPAAQGLMSQRVAVTEQGQLQGATSSLRGISGLLGPFLFTGAFSLFISNQRSFPLPGAPFLLASVFLVFALLIAWRVTRKHA